MNNERKFLFPWLCQRTGGFFFAEGWDVVKVCPICGPLEEDEGDAFESSHTYRKFAESFFEDERSKRGQRPLAHCSNLKCDYTFSLPSNHAGIAWQCPKCYGRDYCCEISFVTNGAALRPANKQLCDRITAYLTSGGLFNPEMAIHARVRDLLIECRDVLAAQPAGTPEQLRELVAKWRKQPKKCRSRKKLTQSCLPAVCAPMNWKPPLPSRHQPRSHLRSERHRSRVNERTNHR